MLHIAEIKSRSASRVAQPVTPPEVLAAPPAPSEAAAKRRRAVADAPPVAHRNPAEQAPTDVAELFDQDFDGPFNSIQPWPLQAPDACPATPIVLLSWFDGIGTAAHALRTLGAWVVYHVVWEVDPACRALLSHHWPQAHLRGSFYDDAFDTIATHISQGLAEAAAAGSTKPALVLTTAGPPCFDFSRIKGAGAAGRSGPEGRKFLDFVNMHLDPLRGHCKKSGVAFTFLIENVVMSNDNREHFDDALQCHSFVCEASDLGPVRRPRLWWTNVEQELHDVPDTKWGVWDPPAEAAARSPTLGEGSPIRIPWLFAQGRVLLPVEAIKGSWRFHPAIMQGKATLPTLTTPAPTDEGRPAPPNARPHGAAKDRWRADRQRFAPWHYADKAIMYSSDMGLNSDAWAVPPPAVREVLHHLTPPGTRPWRGPTAAPGRP